jgi:hypothetical protein
MLLSQKPQVFSGTLVAFYHHDRMLMPQKKSTGNCGSGIYKAKEINQ